MATPYVGEIKMFGGNFAIRGFAFCNGQILKISQNTALFSLLGTNFGGDGIYTFGLPDLMGRTPLHRGQGPGLSPYAIGEFGGVETVTLLSTQIPAHTHSVQGDTAGGAINTPGPGAIWSSVPRGHPAPYVPYVPGASNVAMAANSIATAGNNVPHNNRSPYLAVSFIVALQGVFPART